MAYQQHQQQHPYAYNPAQYPPPPPPPPPQPFPPPPALHTEAPLHQRASGISIPSPAAYAAPPWPAAPPVTTPTSPRPPFYQTPQPSYDNTTSSYHDTNQTISQYDQPPIPPAYGNPAYKISHMQVTETAVPPPPAYADMPSQYAPLDHSFAGLAPEKLQLETEQQPWQPSDPMSFAPPPTNSTLDSPPGLDRKASTASAGGSHPAKIKDDVKHGKMKRFVGDTLVGRFARASMTSASATVKIAGSFSPWGDNNPVVLPNVRYRDAVSFVTVHAITGGLLDNVPDMLSSSLGADNFIAEVVTSGADFLMTGGPAGFVTKIAILQLVEQAIDRGLLEHALPDEEKITTTTNVKILECVIKNKLIDAQADLRFWRETSPSSAPLDCARAWFCPYLMASSRIPSVPRASDFAIAQFWGPYLGADQALALRLLAETRHVLDLGYPMKAAGEGLQQLHAPRLALFVLGITPYRGGRANAWSTSWRPGAGLIRFHLFNGCPAVVVPVSREKCPGVVWSPWTLRKMFEGGYNPERQHGELCEFVDELVDMNGLLPVVRANWEAVLGKAVSLLVNGALGVTRLGEEIVGKMDDERAGIVGIRF